MKTLATLIFILVCGCAQLPQPRTGNPVLAAILPASSAEPAVQPKPARIAHIGFADKSGNWMTSDLWTNYWTLKVIVSPNIDAPLDQWQTLYPVLETCDGRLTFPLEKSQDHLFIRGVFQEIDP